MTQVVLVTGGTGTIGSYLVRNLQNAGATVRVLSRGSRPTEPGIDHVTADLATGEGVEAAMSGVDVIVHAAGSSKGDELKARNLVLAATGTGVRHLVYISVVGADRIPVVSGIDRGMFSYFAAKLAGEQIIAESGIPWTTLRSTQTHELMLMVASGMAKMPIVPLPSGFRVQPIAASEVATRLGELALGEPQGLVPDIAGPEILTARMLFRAYLRSVHRHRLTMPLHLPGRGARAFRGGANLSPDRATGRLTWAEFLDEQVIRSNNLNTQLPEDALAR